MKSSIVLVAIVLTCVARCAVAASQSADATYVDAKDGEIRYRVYLPEGYSKSGPAWPVVLYLHSAAERGDSAQDVFSNSASGRLWTNSWIAPLVKETQEGKHKAILVVPQSGMWQVWNSMTAGDNWGVGDYTNATQKPISPRLQLAVEALQKVLATHNADRTRVYVTGPSMGGFGTWDALARFPEVFAAGIPLSGGGNVEMARTVLKDKPIWMFHGGKDGLISPGNTDALYFAMRQAGGNPIYSRIADEGHGGWDVFYKPGHYTTDRPQATGGKGPGVYDWLFAQKLPAGKPNAAATATQTRPAAASGPTPIVVGFGPGSSGNDRADYTAD